MSTLNIRLVSSTVDLDTHWSFHYLSTWVSRVMSSSRLPGTLYYYCNYLFYYWGTFSPRNTTINPDIPLCTLLLTPTLAPVWTHLYKHTGFWRVRLSASDLDRDTHWTELRRRERTCSVNNTYSVRSYLSGSSSSLSSNVRFKTRIQYCYVY